jgi:hypothetical protein
MKSNFKEPLLSLLMSALIGLFIGLIEITVTLFQPAFLAILLRDGLIGILIGTVARLLFINVFRRTGNERLGFFWVAMVIAIISSLPFAYFWAVLGSFNGFFYLGVLLVSESLGVGLSMIIFNQSRHLNQRLMAKREAVSRDFPIR